MSVFVLGNASNAAELSDIRNYKAYSETFSSSGQPSKEQLELLKAEGFERIAYIAFSNSRGAIAEEGQVFGLSARNAA